MITIDWTSFVLGMALVSVLWFLISILNKIKKPKRDLHNLKKTISDAGIKTKEVYIKLQELFKVFEEMEEK